jgi:hypothetical protein
MEGFVFPDSSSDRNDDEIPIAFANLTCVKFCRLRMEAILLPMERYLFISSHTEFYIDKLRIPMYTLPMKAKKFTPTDKKRGDYIKSLIVRHGVRQRDIAEELDVSDAIVSQVIHGNRQGVVRNGEKIGLVKQAIAKKLGRPVSKLWPDKAA